MGCKKPVVVTDVGGLSSFAVGKIVEKENPKELAQAILEILNMEQNDYIELCQKAFKTAKQYSWQNIVNTKMKYYKKVCDLNKNNRYIEQENEIKVSISV